MEVEITIEIPQGSRNKYELDRESGRSGWTGCASRRRAEISHFFDIYKELEPGKSSDLRGWLDRPAAEQVIRDAFSRVGGPVAGAR
jgi:inorganic pyrophosphatase